MEININTSGRLRLTATILNYNYGRYLLAAVDAMMRQSRPPDEFILIDDASTDGSEAVVNEIVQRYPFIRVIKHTTNRGVVLTMQEAFEAATGDFIYFGSADDMVLAGFFESAMSLLERFPTAPLCAGVPTLWREETNQQFQTCAGMPREPGFLKPAELWPLARRGAFAMGGAWALYRVADLKAFGGFPVSLKWFSDWFPLYALALGHGLAWTARPTAVMRFHSKSYSGTGVNRARENYEVLKEMVTRIETVIPVEMRAGFRNSGVLGHLGWPIVRVLFANRQFCSQMSFPFWCAWLSTMEFQIRASTARAILPTKLRLAIWRRIRSETKFDLSAMQSKVK